MNTLVGLIVAGVVGAGFESDPDDEDDDREGG